MLLAARFGRAIRQLFGNLNQYTPINDLNRCSITLRAEQKTPACPRTGKNPRGGVLRSTPLPAEIPKKCPTNVAGSGNGC
jgi:hypothetical protein